jgi:hypothetical protein
VMNHIVKIRLIGYSYIKCNVAQVCCLTIKGAEDHDDFLHLV